MMNLIDLSVDGHHLDQVFGSVLNKLPDLLQPASYKLAEEQDFFNETSSIVLIPFRKQEYFDSVAKKTNQQLDYENGTQDPTSGKVEANHLRKSYKVLEKVVNKRQTSRLRTGLLMNLAYSEELEKQKRKMERLKKVRHHYSRCRIKKKERVEESGYNKLLVKQARPQYPFAEPIPESMRTDRSIDNLREIVVMEKIDWKMLTPVRPTNEKEERYFDRLVVLHRKRYEQQKRLKLNVPIVEPCFKHIRHKYSMQCNARTKEVFVPLVCRLAECNLLERDSQLEDVKDAQLWDVPKLTVSGEAGSSEPILNQTRAHNNHNSTRAKQQDRGKQEAHRGSTAVDEVGSERNELAEELMDERIEQIVRNLMKTSLEIELS